MLEVFKSEILREDLSYYFVGKHVFITDNIYNVHWLNLIAPVSWVKIEIWIHEMLIFKAFWWAKLGWKHFVGK